MVFLKILTTNTHQLVILTSGRPINLTTIIYQLKSE